MAPVYFTVPPDEAVNVPPEMFKGVPVPDSVKILAPVVNVAPLATVKIPPTAKSLPMVKLMEVAVLICKLALTEDMVEQLAVPLPERTKCV